MLLEGESLDGERYLYRIRDGEHTLIGRVSDSATITIGGGMDSFEVSPITPDGRRIIFRSSESLTGQGTGDVPQLFSYDAAAQLFGVCVVHPTWCT